MQIELLQDVGPVGFNRGGGHAQQIGDVLVAVSFGNQLKDLPLAL